MPHQRTIVPCFFAHFTEDLLAATRSPDRATSSNLTELVSLSGPLEKYSEGNAKIQRNRSTFLSFFLFLLFRDRRHPQNGRNDALKLVQMALKTETHLKFNQQTTTRTMSAGGFLLRDLFSSFSPGVFYSWKFSLLFTSLSFPPYSHWKKTCTLFLPFFYLTFFSLHNPARILRILSSIVYLVLFFLLAHFCSVFQENTTFVEGNVLDFHTFSATS